MESRRTCSTTRIVAVLALSTAAACSPDRVTAPHAPLRRNVTVRVDSYTGDTLPSAVRARIERVASSSALGGTGRIDGRGEIPLSARDVLSAMSSSDSRARASLMRPTAMNDEAIVPYISDYYTLASEPVPGIPTGMAWAHMRAQASTPIGGTAQQDMTISVIGGSSARSYTVTGTPSGFTAWTVGFDLDATIDMLPCQILNASTVHTFKDWGTGLNVSASSAWTSTSHVTCGPSCPVNGTSIGLHAAASVLSPLGRTASPRDVDPICVPGGSGSDPGDGSGSGGSGGGSDPTTVCYYTAYYENGVWVRTEFNGCVSYF